MYNITNWKKITLSILYLYAIILCASCKKTLHFDNIDTKLSIKIFSFFIIDKNFKKSIHTLDTHTLDFVKAIYYFLQFFYEILK